MILSNDTATDHYSHFKPIADKSNNLACNNHVTSNFIHTPKSCWLILLFWCQARELLSSCFPRYNEAAEAYEEGLKTSPGDLALGRGLDDVLKAQSSAKAAAGKTCVLSISLLVMHTLYSTVDVFCAASG